MSDTNYAPENACGDLFDARKAARTTDVQTSHDAAESMESVAGKQHRAILHELNRPYFFSRRCMSAEELEDELGYSVWRRMSELERAGLIERTDEKHKNRSGRMAYKYRAAEA